MRRLTVAIALAACIAFAGSPPANAAVTGSTAQANAVANFASNPNYTAGDGPSRTLNSGGLSNNLQQSGTASTSGPLRYAARGIALLAKPSSAASEATLSKLNIMGGKIKADLVKTKVSIAHATPEPARTFETTVTNLVVNGTARTSPVGKTFPVKHNGVTIANLIVGQTAGSNGPTLKTAAAAGLQLVFTKDYSGFKAGSTYILAYAAVRLSYSA